ncbi:MAG: hypothetical protein JWL77_3361 [Chthonomonadaceae bacterium]|nr:hypothetical protein [Chthonomonadaceae bacterium]
MATPKPIIAQVLRTLRVPPGMIYALVADMEQNLWVVESCPAGTRFWTLEQAADLSQGPRTHRALQDILNLGRTMQHRKQEAVAAKKSLQAVAPLRARQDLSTDRVAPRRQTVERVRSMASGRNLVEV